MIIRNDESRDVDFRRFEFERKAVEEIRVGVKVVRVGGFERRRSSGNSVVTDQGVGEDEDLRRVGRVGEGFGITNHTYSIERKQQ